MKTLKPYQSKILDEIIEKEKNLFSCIIIDLICGAGKSIIIAKLFKMYEQNNLLVVNKYSINQWINLLSSENIDFGILNSKNIKKTNKVLICLDTDFDKTVNTNEFYERVIIDEVSPFIKKNISIKSLILLSATYKELNKYMIDYDNLSSLDTSNYNLYDFYFHNMQENLLKSVQEFNTECSNLDNVNFLSLSENKKRDTFNIINSMETNDKLIIFTNEINNIIKILELRNIRFLLIHHDLTADGISRIQSTFNGKSYNILLVNTDININGISFKMANKAILYNKFDDITTIQCLGRIIRLTNKKNITIYSSSS